MAVTANTGLTLLDSAQAQKDVTANQAFTDLDQGFGMLAKSVAAGGTITLTADENQNGVIVTTGAPGSAVTVTAIAHATQGKAILFVNEATGSNKVLVVKKSGGSNFNLAGSGVVLLLSDTRAVTLLTPTREIAAASEVGLSITAASGQTADLMAWNTSTPTKVLSVAAAGHLTFGEAINIICGTSTGTKIGTATSQKLGFWNATPVVQPSAFTQTYSTASKTHANPTATTLTDNSGGTANTTLQAIGGTYSQAEVANNFADLAAAVNALIADVANVKQVLNAAIDDDQSIGIKS